MPLRNVAGALATVIVAAGVLVGSVAGVRYLWEHLTGRSDHQDYVIVER